MPCLGALEVETKLGGKGVGQGNGRGGEGWVGGGFGGLGVRFVNRLQGIGDGAAAGFEVGAELSVEVEGEGWVDVGAWVGSQGGLEILEIGGGGEFAGVQFGGGMMKAGRRGGVESGDFSGEPDIGSLEEGGIAAEQGIGKERATGEGQGEEESAEGQQPTKAQAWGGLGQAARVPTRSRWDGRGRVECAHGGDDWTGVVSELIDGRGEVAWGAPG